MKKSEFIAKVIETHKAYDEVITKLDDNQMIIPRSCGEWSVKDIIAHVTWYEFQMVGVLETRTLTGSDLWNLSLEERNAAIHAENQTRTLEEILSKAKDIHKALMILIQNLSEDDLQRAENFKDMPSDWIPWEVIASNTFEHYPVHTADIQKAFPRST